MHSRVFFAVAASVALASSIATFSSCKSNDITLNDSNDYVSVVTQDATPGSDTTIDGPDRSQAHIPAGALQQTTTIKLGKMKGGYPAFPDGWQTTGGIYSFEPHAQTFGKPVDIKVPYTDPGAPVRLAVSEPGGGWAPVDGAKLAAGFATTQSAHFSFYTVVTGKNVPPDPTIMDAGPDAPPDATMDAMPEAAPPTLFFTGPNAVYRAFLDPQSYDPDAGFDAGTRDGGSFAVPSANTLGYVPTPSQLLFVGVDPGPTDAGAPSLVTFANPFGAMMQSGTLPLRTPGHIRFYKDELWVYNTTTKQLETYDAQGTMTWSDPAKTVADSFDFHVASSTLYVVQAAAANLLRFTVNGIGSTKTLVSVGADGGTDGGTLGGTVLSPFAVAVTPWDELVVAGTTVHHYGLDGADRGAYPQIQAMLATGVSAIRWPNGTDELVVTDSETARILRFGFMANDSAHMTPVPGQVVPGPIGLGGMIVAP